MSGGVCVIGALNLDLVARVAALPQPGQTVLASSLERYPGGKGLNQAVASARVGAPTRLMGRVGCDEPGDWLLGFLQEAGVEASGVSRDTATPTGQALITVGGDGENCIVVAAGANLALTPVDAPLAAVAGARVLLAQLETAIEPVAALFAADLPGCIKILNAAPALPEGAPLFVHCDILILNETELAAYAGLTAPPDVPAEIAPAARTLLKRVGQTIVVTLGAEGALVVQAGNVRHVPAQPARVVDTVGAGDCFCGVLAASLCEGLDVQGAVTRATAAAAIAVSRSGAANAMPTRGEIDAACT